MSRRALMGTAGVSSGLLDSSGNPMPASTVQVDIRSLPLIERAALPSLPHDMEARLLQGDETVIVLFHPRSELSIEVPLTDMNNLEPYVEALNTARLKQAMGEPPENGEGYRVDG